MIFRRLPRRTLFIVVLLLTWVSLAADTARALFSDSATLVGNTITTSSSELLVSNSQNQSSTTYASTRPGFSIALSPGQDSGQFFLLKNASDADTDLSIDASVIVTGGSQTIKDHIRIEFAEVDSEGVFIGARAVAEMRDLVDGQRVSLNSVVPKGSTRRYAMITSLDPNFTQSGDGVTYDLVLTGTQTLGG